MTEFDESYLKIQLASLKMNQLIFDPLDVDLTYIESSTRIPNVEKESYNQLREAINDLNRKFMEDINTLLAMGTNISDLDKYLEKQVSDISTRKTDINPLPINGGVKND